MTLKNYDDISARDALRKANEYAVAPFIFQSIVAMKNLGVFKALDDCPNNCGLTKAQLAIECKLSYYAISVLVDLAVTADILIRYDDKYSLSKVGIYLASDKMTNVNLDFASDVCYKGLEFLTESLKKSKAEGLKVFTDKHDTIYPIIGSLPGNAKTSWFAFDHYYSDHLFASALKEIFSNYNVKKIYDVGGNTGKFAIETATYNSEVSVTVIDLPEQCALAEKNIAQHNFQDRINTYPINILSDNAHLPQDADIWWMSQFLDCFSIEQIERILKLIVAAMKDNSLLVINELFGDRQKNDIATMVIDANSLYFTALANGKSRFYHATEFVSAIEKSGLIVEKEISGIGIGHTLLFLKKKI